MCGSGWNNAAFVDTTAVNGTTYYYVVQSVNPVGASTNWPQSAGTTPSGALSSSPPLAPAGLTAASAGHQTVSLNWAASAGANYYTIYRSTLFNNGGGAVAIDIGTWMTAPYTGAANMPALVDSLNTLLLAGQLSGTAKTSIVNYVTNTASGYFPAGINQQRDRVRAVVHLLTCSPEFTVQK